MIIKTDLPDTTGECALRWVCGLFLLSFPFSVKKRKNVNKKQWLLQTQAWWDRFSCTEISWAQLHVLLPIRFVPCFSALYCSLFRLSFTHTGPFTCIFFITLFKQYHYPISECDCLFGGYTAIMKNILPLVTPEFQLVSNCYAWQYVYKFTKSFSCMSFSRMCS